VSRRKRHDARCFQIAPMARGSRSLREVTQAAERTLLESAYIYQPRVLGVDVARFGDDRTVFAPRRARGLRHEVMRGLDTQEVAGQVAHSIRKWQRHAVFMDDTGLGGGVTDRLNALGYGAIVIPVVSARRALNSVEYPHLRDEMWFRAGSHEMWQQRCAAGPPRPAPRLLGQRPVAASASWT
jgi:hypothetical protein